MAKDSVVVNRLRGRKGVERRARWLRAHPLCVECSKQGRVTAATVPDHIIALTNGGVDDETNLQSLCAEHHRQKTARDLGSTPKRTIGPDGWPIEQEGPQEALAKGSRSHGRASDRRA